MWFDWLAVGAIVGIAAALVVLGWERPPVPLVRTRGRRDLGWRGMFLGLSEEVRARLQAQIGGELPAGMTPQKFLLAILLAVSATTLLLLWMGFGGVALVGGGVAGYIAAAAYANAAAKKRREKLEAQILAAAEIMGDVIPATGQQAMEVLAEVANRLGNPIYEEVGPLVARVAAGDTVGQAVVDVQEKAAGVSPLLVQFLAMLREMYRSTGEGRIDTEGQAAMVRAFAEQADREEALRKDVEVLSSPGRTTRWMAAAIIVGVLLFQFAVQPDVMRGFVSTTFGQVAMAMVMGLILAAIVLGDRIARVD